MFLLFYPFFCSFVGIKGVIEFKDNASACHIIRRFEILDSRIGAGRNRIKCLRIRVFTSDEKKSS